MICFEIRINGKKVCTAGIGSEFGALSSILDWVKRDLNEFPQEKRDKIQDEELRFDLAGHKSFGKNDYENLTWIRQSLSVGDELTIKIIESDQCDEPYKKERSDPDFIEKERRKFYKKMKQEYE